MLRMRGCAQYYKEAVIKRLPFIANRSGSGRMAVRNRFADLRQRIPGDSPVIVDGGANRGDVTDIFLWQYRSPTLHLFEPHPVCVAHLRRKYARCPNVHLHEQALGDRTATIEFHLSENTVSSSALPPSETGIEYAGDRLNVTETVSVPQVRLDEVLDGNIDILKLDLQGYELQALRGCTNLLEQTRTITTEIEFVPLYEGQPLMGDLDAFLRSTGFRLLNFYELYTHRNGQLTAGDAVYLNTRYF